MDKVITDLTTNINSGLKGNLSGELSGVSSKLSSESSGRLSERSISDELLGESGNMISSIGELNDRYQNWGYLFYIISILLVIFIIMNVIMYFEYLTLQFNHYLGRLFNTSLEVTEKGAEGTLDIVSDTLHGNMHTLSEIINQNTLKNNINNKNITESNQENEKEILPIESQYNKSISKKGYCYVGNDRGHRSCVKVSDDDECMSGEVFPSIDICINPSLRE